MSSKVGAEIITLKCVKFIKVVQYVKKKNQEHSFQQALLYEVNSLSKQRT